VVTLRPIAGRALLVVVSVGVTLACAEWALRGLAPELVAPAGDWALLSDFYEPNADGVYTWPPNRRIRYVRLHGDRVEYDVSFPANDLGLVDGVSYANPPESARNIALVGDSFTAGYHGGDPWVPALRERLQPAGVRLHNLGVGGAGVLQFEALLASVGKSVAFSDVVLVVISDDLLRPRWLLDVRGDEARFCLESWPRWLCRLRPVYFHRIDLVDDPLARAEQVRRASAGAGRSALASLLVHVVRAAERTERERARRIAANEAALAAIVRAHGGRRVSVVHLPVRAEVERGAYDDYARHLGELARTLGVGYFPALFECRWKPEMFFANDAHPNAVGYAQVSSCVARWLREQVLSHPDAASVRAQPNSG
jgi:lysophospholipase L1-like esterase